MEVGMKWRFDITMACGIKGGYRHLIAAQGNGLYVLQ